MNPPEDLPAGLGPLGLVLRFAALLALMAGLAWGAHLLRDALNLHVVPSNEQAVHRMIMLGMLAYVVLLALPFVPGAEIGLALLAAFGEPIVPLVYGATIFALMMAFAVGWLVPPVPVARALARLRLRRAAELVARAAALPREARLAMLLDGAPPRVVALALRHRYLALAVSVNLPGNAIVGGGGGILMMAGMSGVFAPLPTFLTLALAVSPVPLAVFLAGG